MMTALVLVICSGSAFGAALYNTGFGLPGGVVWDGSKPVVAIGNTATYGTKGAFLWDPIGGSQSISTTGTVPGAGCIAMKGSTLVVVGNGIGGAASAKRWDGTLSGGGAWTALPLAGGLYNFSATSVAATASEVYVAGSYGNTNTTFAARYQESANNTVNLPAPTGYHNNSGLSGVSTNGTCAGNSQFGGTLPADGKYNAVGGWTGTALAGFNCLNGPPTNALVSQAMNIALDSSRASGFSEKTAGLRTPCYWNGPFTANGVAATAIPFITGSGHNHGASTAISANGSMMGGYSMTSGSNPSRTCWLWDSVNGTRSLGSVLTGAGLNISGWQFMYVVGFANGNNVITGYGYRDGDLTKWVGFTAVIPEPGSMIALLSGLVGLVGFGVRRRK